MAPAGEQVRCWGQSCPRWWADRIAEWDDGGLDVQAYFNNDGDGNAVRNAATLRLCIH